MRAGIATAITTTRRDATARGSSAAISRYMPPRARTVPDWATAVLMPKTRVRSWWSCDSSAPSESCGIENTVVPEK
jgi:hypothetical protein